MFNHKNQKEFYSDYAIKDGQSLNETNLNLFGKRLKKEVDDIHNLLQIFAGLTPIEYSAIVEYEAGEIVSYKGTNYISVASVQGEEPGKSQKWMELTGAIIQGQGLNTLGDYLSKYNQTPYEPGELSEGENTITYHPATVKFVEDRIKWYLKNGVITNSDRLDGYHASYFATLEQLTEIEQKIKSNDLSKFEPYIIPFTTDDLNKITTTLAENFTDILTTEAFNNLYSVISKLEKYDLRFSDTDNQVLATNLEASETEMKLMLCISGPFKGFGCAENDFVNGMITIRLTLNLQKNAYTNIEIQSNILKKVTQSEYDALPVKSEYVNYIITQDYTDSEELVSYLNLFKTSTEGKGSLRWSEPSNFRGSRLVFNANNIPVSENDGTTIEEISVKNKYAINGLLVDISSGGYYKVFPKTARGSYYSDARNAVAVADITEPLSQSVTDLKIIKQNKSQVTISWKDPTDYVCEGSKIVIKEGSAPDTITDGTTIGDYEISATAHEVEVVIPKSGPKHFIKIFPKLFNDSYANSKLNVLEVQYTTEMWFKIDETQSDPALAITRHRDAKRKEDIYLKISQNLGANPVVNVSTNIPISDLKYNTTADGLNLQPFSNICALTDDNKWQITAPNATYRIFHKDFYARIGDLKVGSGSTSIDFQSDSIGERQLFEYSGIYNNVITQHNGKELYKLNPDDLTKTIDGEAADITTLGNDVFATAPRRGYVMYPETYSFFDYDKIEDYTISENYAGDIGGWRLKKIELRNKDKTNDYLDCYFEQIVGVGTTTEVKKSYAITKTAGTTSNKIQYTSDISLETKIAKLKFTKPMQFEYEFIIPDYAIEFSVKSVTISSDKFYFNIQYTCKDDKNVTTTIYDTCEIPWDLTIQSSSFDYEFRTEGTKWYIDIKNMLLAYKRKQGRMWTAKYLEPYTLTEKLAGYDSVSIRNASVRSDNNYIDIVYSCKKGDTITNVSKAYAITAANKKHLSSLDFLKNSVECNMEYTSDTAIVQVSKLICNSQISTGKYVWAGFTDDPQASEIKNLEYNHSVTEKPVYTYDAHTWELDLEQSVYEDLKSKISDPDELRKALNSKVEKLDCESFSIGVYPGYESGGTIYSSSARAPQVNIDLSTSRRYCRVKGQDNGYTLATVAQRHYITALYCLVFGHLNGQTKVGLGYGWNSWDGNKKAYNSGACNKLGANYEFATDTQRTNGRTQVKMLGVEDYWGNIWQRYDGLRIDASGNLLTANGNFDRTDMYENLGPVGSGSDVYFSSIQGTTKGGFTPNHEGSISGSDSTYYSDMFWQSTNTAAYFGGAWRNGAKCGPFCLALNRAPSFVAVDIGLRLAKFNALGAIEASRIRNITFDCAGGSLAGVGDFNAPGEDGKWSAKTGEDGRLTELPKPKYPGYKFLGWFLGDTQIQVSKTYYVDTELTAKWEITPRYTITFATDGGAFPEGENGTRETNDNMQIESLPDVSKEGFHFLGWFLGDTQISLETEFAKAETITAKWQQSFKVQFVLDGGTLVSGNNPSYTDANRRLTEYPVATRENFTFAGWWDSPTDGTQYGIGSEYTADTVLYARWQ